MKTISQAVSEYVKSKPFLSSALSDGIINFTSLSRKIKPDIEEILRKKVNNGAIVMALNRLSINLEFQHTQKIKRVIKKIQEISVRSNLVDYNFKVSNTILNRLGDPYVSSRSSSIQKDDKGSGLGLGFFISKTLLERLGIKITAYNRPPPETGAIVSVLIPTDKRL